MEGYGRLAFCDVFGSRDHEIEDLNDNPKNDKLYNEFFNNSTSVFTTFNEDDDEERLTTFMIERLNINSVQEESSSAPNNKNVKSDLIDSSHFFSDSDNDSYNDFLILKKQNPKTKIEPYIKSYYGFILQDLFDRFKNSFKNNSILSNKLNLRSDLRSELRKKMIFFHNKFLLLDFLEKSQLAFLLAYLENLDKRFVEYVEENYDLFLELDKPFSYYYHNNEILHQNYLKSPRKSKLKKLDVKFNVLILKNEKKGKLNDETKKLKALIKKYEQYFNALRKETFQLECSETFSIQNNSDYSNYQNENASEIVDVFNFDSFLNFD